MELERLHDACGIVGIYVREDSDHIDVRRYLTLALTALQHRGQESAVFQAFHAADEVRRKPARPARSLAGGDAEKPIESNSEGRPQHDFTLCPWP